VKVAPAAGLAEEAVSAVKTPVRMPEVAEDENPPANASASAAELDDDVDPATEERAPAPELLEGEDP